MPAGTREILFEKRNEMDCIQLWKVQTGEEPEYELMINGVFIMASYNALSSELLVRGAIEQYTQPPARILIGGLGLGYSVREAWNHRDILAHITVVEINPLVIKCNEEYLYNLNGKYLRDEKITVIRDDFISHIRNTGEAYDIICMDIDNGPMLLVHEWNEKAYSISFIGELYRRLSDKGIFVIWSCNKDDAMLDTIRQVFPRCFVEEVFETHNGKQVPYYLYFACKS